MRVAINDDRRPAMRKSRSSGPDGRCSFINASSPLPECCSERPSVEFPLVAGVRRCSSKTRDVVFTDGDSRINTWSDTYTIDGRS